MTSNVHKVFNFIDLISDPSTTNRQCKYLLESTSELQVAAICEIIYNIVYGQLKFSKKDLKALKSHSKLIDFLLSKKKPLKQKQYLLVRYNRFILNILRRVRKQLIKFLK